MAVSPRLLRLLQPGLNRAYLYPATSSSQFHTCSSVCCLAGHNRVEPGSSSADGYGPATLTPQHSLQVFAAEPARADPEPDVELPHDLPFDPVPKRAFVPLDFNDPRAAFEPKSSFRLLRNWAVLSTCQIKPLVKPYAWCSGPALQ